MGVQKPQESPSVAITSGCTDSIRSIGAKEGLQSALIGRASQVHHVKKGVVQVADDFILAFVKAKGYLGLS